LFAHPIRARIATHPCVAVNNDDDACTRDADREADAPFVSA
jgi:hypothetical protein